MNYPRLSFFCLMFLTITTNCCASVSIRVRSFSLSSFGGRLLISYRNLSASLPIRMGVFLIGLAILLFFITIIRYKNKQKKSNPQTFPWNSAYLCCQRTGQRPVTCPCLPPPARRHKAASDTGYASHPAAPLRESLATQCHCLFHEVYITSVWHRRAKNTMLVRFLHGRIARSRVFPHAIQPIG